jgi:tetraacyldisaccharide 4'-kinase
MISRDRKLIRTIAWLPAKAYELGVRLRVAAYETRYAKSRALDSAVISVGNISVGGSGKTTLTGYIASYLRKLDHEVAILTRGYGRISRGQRVLNVPGADAAPESFLEVGDEPLMMARALPEVPIIVDEDRYRGGRWAETHLGTKVLVLDDAYQHLSLQRDLNLLLLDATDPFGGFEMVPFGRLREPLYGIRRADAVVVTRADRPFDQAQTTAIIKYFCGDQIPVMYFYSSISRLRHLKSGEVYDVAELRGWNVAVMCAVGNPRAFVDDILQAGINVSCENFFRDHHAFTQADLNRVTEEARSAGADAILTTEKDAVRLENLVQGEIPIYSALLELQSEDEVRFKSLLLRTIVEK